MPVWCGGWTNPTANPPSGGGVLYYNNGNVGIGTTGPQTKLDISLAGNATEATLRTTVANNAINLVGPYVNNNFYPGIVWSTSDNSPTLTKAGIWAKHTNSGSYLNFGTSNAYGTGINNTAMVIDYNGNVGIGTVSPVGMFQVGGGTLTVTTSGNVGIGTTSPGATLDVNGTIRGATYGFGGMYNYDTEQSVCAVANQFTGACSCPTNFTSKEVLSIDSPGASWYHVYYCYR